MRILNKQFWPSKISMPKPVNDPTHAQIKTWLSENMGQVKYKWNMVPQHQKVDYYFRTDTDAAWFALRWE